MSVSDQVLVEQNPHWAGKLYDGDLRRNCFDNLVDSLETGQIVAVTGVRRAGKSTLLKQLIKHLTSTQKVAASQILFLNLEHPYFSPYHEDVTNLQRIFDSYRKLMAPKGDIYCLLDEVQFFKDWPLFVKAQHETKAVRFVITGSNAAMISSDMITMLSGRSLPLEVFPFSFRELAHKNELNIDHPMGVVQHQFDLQRLLDEYLQFGGFPTVVCSRPQRSAFNILGAHAKTVLLQDVAPRLAVRKTAWLEQLYVYLVSNVGKLSSYSSLSKLFELSDKTIAEYIQAFEDAYLLFQVSIFSYSLKQQMRSPKKIYSIDTGQANAMGFRFSSDKGRLLENLVYLELKRLGVEVYYYKTSKGRELDFVLRRGTQIALVQVCWDLSSDETYEREVRALQDAMVELKESQGLLLCMETGGRAAPPDGITITPLYRFLSLPPEDKLSQCF